MNAAAPNDDPPGQTENKDAAERALRESEEKYRSLFDSIDEGYLLAEVIFDENRTPRDILYLEANPAAIRIAGRDFTGCRMREIDPDYEEYWFETYGRVALTGEPVRAEHFAAPNGRWFEFYASKVGGEESRLVATVFQDITERKRVEGALHASAAQQSFLLRLQDRLRALSNPREIMAAAAEALGRELKTATVQYLLMENDQETAEAVAVYNDGRMIAPSLGSRFRLSRHGAGWRDELRAGREVFSSDNKSDPRGLYGAACFEAGSRASFAVPLIRNQEMVAVLAGSNPEPREWSESDQRLIRETAARTWAAVERGRAETALRTSEEQLRRANAILAQRLEQLEAASRNMRESRLATLNLLEDSMAVRDALAAEISERQHAETALRESEERLRLILENVREYAIFSLDLDRRITSWNSGAQAILGYASEEIIGESGDIIFTPEDRAHGAPESEMATALAEGRAADERWHLRKDGSRFWGSGVMTPMRDADGRAIGLVKIFRDQTAELRAKEALEKSREELRAALVETEHARAKAEAAGQAKDHFLAVLSHELRTPLMPVLTAARALLRRKDLPAGAKDALGMIQRNVEIEAQFIDELLDLTRIARGKMELVREPLDAREVIQRAVEVSRPDVKARKQKLTVSLDAQQHEVCGDFLRLQQVFWNLLKNASKFTPEKGEICIRSRNEAERLVVEVSDTGIGIEAAALSKIFDAFVQADESIAREFGGLGLGLALAKATVEGHGGVIRAASAGREHGAAFTVELPLLRGESELC